MAVWSAANRAGCLRSASHIQNAAEPDFGPRNPRDHFSRSLEFSDQRSSCIDQIASSIWLLATQRVGILTDFGKDRISFWRNTDWLVHVRGQKALDEGKYAKLVLCSILF